MRQQAAQLCDEADSLESEEERLAEEEERDYFTAQQAQWGTPVGMSVAKGQPRAPAHPGAAARKIRMGKPGRLVAWLVCAASVFLTAASVFTVPILKPLWGPSPRVYDLACVLPVEAAQLFCSGDTECIERGAALIEDNAVTLNALPYALCPKMLCVEHAAKLGNLSWLKPMGETVAAKAVMAGYGRAVWIQLFCLVAFYLGALNLLNLGRHGTGLIGTVLAAAGGLILAEGGNVPIDAALLIIGMHTLAVAAR